MSFETAIMNEIRTVPNFPKEGINFIDITSFLAKGLLPVVTKEFVGVIESHFQPYEGEIVNVAIVSPESRGFIFGTPVADRIQSPFIPARKKGNYLARQFHVSILSSTVLILFICIKRTCSILKIITLK